MNKKEWTKQFLEECKKIGLPIKEWIQQMEANGELNKFSKEVQEELNNIKE